VSGAIGAALEKTTLADLVERQKLKIASPAVSYEI